MRHLVLLLAATGCTVGEVKIPGSGPDGGGDGGANPRLTCADRGQLSAAHIHTDAPLTNRAGLGCMDAGGCHGPAPGAGGAYAFAGTAYKEIGGATAQPTAVVRLFKENPTGVFAQVGVAVTDDAGNFFFAGALADFPYVAEITACGADAAAAPIPGVRAMAAKIQQGNGNCNGGAACHAVPGTQAVYLAD
jgi:hypothetical protein